FARGDQALGRALAGAQGGLGGLLRVPFGGEDVDPALPATLDLAGHRDTGSLDLAVGEPAGLEGLQAVLAELHVRLPAREPGTASAVDLAVLDALRGQHLAPTSLRAAATAAAATTAAATATATAAEAAPATATGSARATRPAAPAAAPTATAVAIAAIPAATAAPAVVAALVVARLLRGLHLGEVGAAVALGHDLALVDPALH